ncbi:hypothetical protein [Mucilaginibacter sp.]|uniref:hypothetical protein n=1 Tax=Mucilaginibacter sp. TaxID=1882438 RepID=UPI0026189327|nr:hypothetical protein [Mucilaginibacter sp.]MDB5128346.1 hypothetical protein [Mucilaginibacter sp.]
MKILNTVIFAFVITSLVATALVILLVNCKLWKETTLLLTADGLLNYLKAYGEFKDLFVVTIAATAAYVGLQSLQETVFANRERLKQERFNEWKGKMDIRLLEAEKHNPRLRLLFMEHRVKYFNWLDDHNFSISNKQELALSFAIFSHLVRTLEDQNERTIKMGQIYPDADYSYSFDGLRFMFIGGPDHMYPELEIDLKKFYIELLPADRLIDLETFKAAKINSFPNFA